MSPFLSVCVRRRTSELLAGNQEHSSEAGSRRLYGSGQSRPLVYVADAAMCEWLRVPVKKVIIYLTHYLTGD
jgi:hypothetical protein